LTHLRHEERWMQEIGYPDLAAHRKEHETLRLAVAALRRRNTAGEDAITIEMMLCLADWLKHHISNSDQRIAAYHHRTQAGAGPVGMLS
ncbi:MAG: hemerythrin domain-containing protein, partial [Acidobacteria bacterium]|nr:hemerythrin domain-containing protein [Acidobacteriota bacterium]